MSTVELLEELIELAKRLGYTVRQEWLDGKEGGACEFAGKKWLFIDLSMDAREQLDQVVDALSGDPEVAETNLPCGLRRLFGLGKAA